MASTILSDNGVSSGSAGIKTTADSTGSLALQTTTAAGAATTAVTIDTSQNVGIGTSSPAQKLTVSGSSGDTRILLTDSTASSNLFIGVNSSTVDIKGVNGFPMVLYTSNTERMRIDTSGNVGIGTSSPGYRLTISKAGENYINIINTTNTISSYMGVDTTGVVIQSAGAYSIKFLPNNTEAMRIDSSGNVGIGTSSPAYKLDIQGTLGTTGAITPNQTAGIVGTTTNNNANAGSIGEVVSSSVAVGSAVSITTAASATSGKTVTSISLTAGDWDIFGTIGINLAAGTKFTVIGGGINTVTNELNALYEEQLLINYGAGGLVPLNTQTYQIPTTRVSISSTTTYYLIAYAQFTVNTATGYGRITARRRR